MSSSIIGTLGAFFAILGTGLVCCRINVEKVVPIKTVATVFCITSGMLIGSGWKLFLITKITIKLLEVELNRPKPKTGAAGTVFPILFKAPTESLEQTQINEIIGQDFYQNSSEAFSYGICMYLSWGSMVFHGVGCSLFTFTACLYCCDGEKKHTKVINIGSERGLKISLFTEFLFWILASFQPDRLQCCNSGVHLGYNHPFFAKFFLP